MIQNHSTLKENETFLLALVRSFASETLAPKVVKPFLFSDENNPQCLNSRY
jgi:hypothetical protein